MKIDQKLWSPRVGIFLTYGQWCFVVKTPDVSYPNPVKVSFCPSSRAPMMRRQGLRCLGDSKTPKHRSKEDPNRPKPTNQPRVVYVEYLKTNQTTQHPKLGHLRIPEQPPYNPFQTFEHKSATKQIGKAT